MSGHGRYFNQAKSLLAKKREPQSHLHAKYIIATLGAMYNYSFKMEDKSPALMRMGKLIRYPIDVHLWKYGQDGTDIWVQVDGEIHVSSYIHNRKTKLRDEILSQYFKAVGQKYIVFKKFEVLDELDNNQILDRLGIKHEDEEE